MQEMLDYCHDFQLYSKNFLSTYLPLSNAHKIVQTEQG